MIGITPGFEPTAWQLCRALAESGPVPVIDFDDEWTPAGDNYRAELVSGGLIDPDYPEGNVVLTGPGVALAQAEGPPAAKSTAQA
jgi:hypothetical protein